MDSERESQGVYLVQIFTTVGLYHTRIYKIKQTHFGEENKAENLRGAGVG